MLKKIIKVAVTGAAGHIGYALLFRLASGQVFGSDVQIELALLELESRLPALRGIVMELEDCAFALLKKITISSDPNIVFQDVDWALLVGSVPRKEGMERQDLLKINAHVFIEQGQALNRVAKKDCKVLVVGNPCNTNALIAKDVATTLNEKNFFAMTLLDEHRAKAQLAIKAKVDITEIHNMAIWGNHSATQFPDFYHATIKGQNVMDVIQDDAWLKEIFLKTVQQRGAEIIKIRGLSSAASAANAIVDTVKAILTPTKPGEFFSLAVVSDGSYNIPQGLVFSFPVVSDGEQCFIVPNIQHNDWAQEKINQTLKELLYEKENVEIST